MKIKVVFLFPNEMLAVIDENGEQVFEHQGRVTIKGLIELLRVCDENTEFKFNCDFYDPK